MAIKIKTASGSGPHAEAAEQIKSEVMITEENKTTGEVEHKHHSHETEAVILEAGFEIIEVGMDFKMPVAQYTMLGFSVKRTVPYDPVATNPDDVFTKTKNWVEEKLNGLIADQQNNEG